jgi:hypothetical protein
MRHEYTRIRNIFHYYLLNIKSWQTSEEDINKEKEEMNRILPSS